MNKAQRWVVGNKLYLLLYLVIAFIAYIDGMQIRTFFGINTVRAWNLYNQYTLPSLIQLWLLLFAGIALVYYMFAKDKSEAVGLFLAGVILLFTGLEDVLFFVFTSQPMQSCMTWFVDANAPVAYWAKWVFQQDCVSPLALVSFMIFGMILSFIVFKKLQAARW